MGQYKIGRKAYMVAYRAANKEKIAATTSRWQKANLDKKAAISRRWHEENKEKSAAINARCAKENRGRCNAGNARYEAAKLKATPAWRSDGAILAMYEEAITKTRDTGIIWHVDHIVPLQSKIVCGLHCESNLQVITGSENCRKRNYHWPDMPEKEKGYE